jgi:hypothetical protein
MISRMNGNPKMHPTRIAPKKSVAALQRDSNLFIFNPLKVAPEGAIKLSQQHFFRL